MRYNEILYANFHLKAMLDAHEVLANQYEPITLVYPTNQLDRTVNIIGHSKPDPPNHERTSSRRYGPDVIKCIDLENQNYNHCYNDHQIAKWFFPLYRVTIQQDHYSKVNVNLPAVLSDRL